jgi:aspartate--ammonia ligase
MKKPKNEKVFIRKGNLILPENYRSPLDVRETERAIKFIKDYFQNHLSKALKLQRVSAPLFVTQKSGINDHLNNVERPVIFTAAGAKEEAEIVQSLAKWKRAALVDYGFKSGEGLYTDMNAIRPDEYLDNLHSVYVDQWDWEKIINEKERNVEFLKYIVRKIYAVMRKAEHAVCRRYKMLLKPILPPQIHFVHSEDLEEMYPTLSPQERENEICREKGAVFIIGIGYPLKDGMPHDGRAADYDDWWTPTGKGRHGLNGDIIVWYPPLNCAFELSSMGIRVDVKSLAAQLKMRKREEDAKLPYHRRLINGELPHSIGGGIGQSRLCMFFLRKAHIGEVQVGVWPDKMISDCKSRNIFLL